MYVVLQAPAAFGLTTFLLHEVSVYILLIDHLKKVLAAHHIHVSLLYTCKIFNILLVYNNHFVVSSIFILHVL